MVSSLQHLAFTLTQGSGNPGAPELDDPMDQDQDKDNDENLEDEEKNDEEDDGAMEEEEEKRRAEGEGEEEPPAFGVEGDGGDSAVLEVAKEEVRVREDAKFW